MGYSHGLRYSALTDVGKTRDHNEDNYLVDKKLSLFVVCDGMGGHAAGEVASAIAVRTLHEEIKRERDVLDRYVAATTDGEHPSGDAIRRMLETCVQRACLRIHEESQADASKRGMGTTLSALLVAGDRGFVAHVGDSRVYLMRAGRTTQITEDHTVLNELRRQRNVDAEELAKLAPKNAVTRAVGVYDRVEVDTMEVELATGDQFLIASDGLHGYFDDPADIEPFLREADGERATKALIDFANAEGGKDNITVILVRVGGEETPEAAAHSLRLVKKRDVIAKSALFGKLSEREVLRLMRVAKIRSYGAGEAIVREGEKGDEVFVVLDGDVEVCRHDSILRTLGPGEHFGEMSLVRSTPRSATIRARSRCEVVVLHRSDFFEIVQREKDLAVKLLWQLLSVLADRLDMTSADLRIAREMLFADDLSDDLAPEDRDEPEPSTIRRPLSGGPPPTPFSLRPPAKP